MTVVALPCSGSEGAWPRRDGPRKHLPEETIIHPPASLLYRLFFFCFVFFSDWVSFLMFDVLIFFFYKNKHVSLTKASVFLSPIHSLIHLGCGAFPLTSGWKWVFVMFEQIANEFVFTTMSTFVVSLCVYWRKSRSKNTVPSTKTESKSHVKFHTFKVRCKCWII